MVLSDSICPNGGTAMKTILSALIALSVIAGIAGPAASADVGSRDFWEQQDRVRY
jgi:hypothetical protein